MAPCGALSVTVREPTDACYCFCVRFAGTGGPRRDHQTVPPVLRTIASVIGSNRFFVLHFENHSVSIPLGTLKQLVAVKVCKGRVTTATVSTATVSTERSVA